MLSEVQPYAGIEHSAGNRSPDECRLKVGAPWTPSVYYWTFLTVICQILTPKIN